MSNLRLESERSLCPQIEIVIRYVDRMTIAKTVQSPPSGSGPGAVMVEPIIQ